MDTRPAPEAFSVWEIDNTHSGVGFQIRHFVSKVRGKFTNVQGTITGDDASWENAVIDVEIATASISTDNERRDNHLRSSDLRLDYGVKWNRAIEAGGAILGDEVKVEINIEAVRARM